MESMLTSKNLPTVAQFILIKKTFSVILLALVDAHYIFIMINVGSFGRSNDGGIFSHSELGKRIENGSLNITPGSCLPGTNIEAPLVIVDEAFL
jgi:hypothetical protein